MQDAMTRPGSPLQTGEATLAKVGWRLVPFLGLLYFVAFLDRVNVGFAALTMNQDIGLSAAAYGLGAGIFFVGYVLFEVPSNLVLARVGARRWIARIMITWGLVSAGMALVQTPMQFYVLRFLLGVAEAGFFPGIIYYIGCWFPVRYRARMLGGFFFALPLSGVVGAPVSTLLLGMDAWGLAGWQWMFIIEGLPAVLLGFVVLGYLTDRPAEAGWLRPEERAWLEAELERERRAQEAVHRLGLRQSLLDRRVWAFGIAYFGLVLGLYAVNFWLPQMIRGVGDFSYLQVGLLVAIPSGLAGLAMIGWGMRSDRRGERRWHVAIPAMAGSLVFAAAALSGGSAAIGVAAVGLGMVLICAALPVFWTLPAALLSGAAAAGGIALVNSIGNLGGFFGPFVTGSLKELTGSFAPALWILAAGLACAGLVVLRVGRGLDPRAAG